VKYSSEFLSGYEEASLGCAYYPLPDAGYLLINGEDRLSFLQRQTTNDVRVISPDNVVVTVLTSPNARIMDVLSLIEQPESIGAITLPGYASKTADFLSKRIFFKDKVNLENQSKDFNQIDLIGPRSVDMMRNIGLKELPDKYGIKSITIDGLQVQTIGLEIGYWRLLFPPLCTETIEHILIQTGGVCLNNENYNTLLVESGLPQAGKELTDQFTPLEVNLEGLISDQKGCYTGQEVIARQLTYDKVTRHLVGLKLSSPARPGDNVYPLDQDRPIGKITSVAISPRFGPIALAVIKRPFNQIGSEVVNRDDRYSWRATVSDLPFS
jgi:tRNA-modifying protein YgfZ